MSKVGKFILKSLLIALYPVFVGATIALGVIAYLRTNELNQANARYRDVRAQYLPNDSDQANLPNGITQIGDALAASTKALEEANKKLEDSLNEISGGIVKKNFGQVRGEILPFVTGGSSLAQYQRVCAESVKNTKQQYCVSVSAIGKSYELILPVGEYYVFAQLMDESLTDTIKNYKAYYTEFVECAQAKKVEDCAENLSSKKANVFVENSKTVEKINPIGWNIEGLDNN